MWPRRDKPPGQGHWPTSQAEAACRSAGSRTEAAVRDGTAASGTLPCTDVLLPRMRTGRAYTVRSTSPSLPAGFLNYSLEGRVQKVTVHWLTHANTFHRTRRTAWNRLQVWKLSGQALLRACSSEGRTARAAGDQHSTGMPLAGPFLIRSTKPQGTPGFTWTRNVGAKPDKGELITKAIYPIVAVATHRQPTRSDVLLLRKAASLNEGGRT